LSVDKTTALIKGANSFASLVFPTPGKPLKRIINNDKIALTIFNISVRLLCDVKHDASVEST
jgi:hypothetical protein